MRESDKSPIVADSGQASRYWSRGALALLPIGAFAVAAWLLQRFARTTNYRAVARGFRAVPGESLLAALVLAAASYLALAALEALALWYAGAKLSPRRILLTSFTASAIGHALGFPVITSSAVRYRLYTAWGVDATTIGRAIAFGSLTFWIGLTSAAAVVLLAGTGTAAAGLSVSPVTVALLGAGCAAVVGGYVALSAVRKEAVGFGSLRLPAPRVSLAIGQVVLSVLDWTLAGAMLYVLLPGERPPLAVVLGVFLIAQLAGLLSHVPAGLGVIEATIVALLAPWTPAGHALVALFAYRLIYYAIPFVIACILLAARELVARREPIISATRFVGARVPSLVPLALAGATFAAGAVLTLSAATPPVHARMELLHSLSPSTVTDSAVLLTSVVGAALLLVARGLYRRLDGAWMLAAALLAAGAVLSILKGLDYEESFFLLLVLLALAPARRFFNRRSTLTSLDFDSSWIVGISIVLGASMWLVFFSHEHVLLASDTWWQLEISSGATMSLRATLGAVLLALVIGIARLMNPVQPPTLRPRSDDLALAARIAAASPSTAANLALLGDKALLFNDAGTAFLMYAVIGRSWVAMGDPVGPPSEREALAWRFRELADSHGGRAVFYLVSPEDLHMYVDLGLTLLKLGESARIPLDSFSLQGGERKWLRRARKTALEAGCTFEVVEPAGVAALLPELRAVSDQWLAAKETREKGFSLGFFDEEYLQRFPLAVVRRGNAIVAFANLWTSECREELSVDLMRYADDAPPGVNDFLMCEVLLWGREQGYRWFDLGMAPLSGLDPRPWSPLWNRAATLLYRHGEGFYNFQGLRRFKEKFDPIWEPRYLATPGHVSVPSVIGNVTTLVSRGISGVVRK